MTNWVKNGNSLTEFEKNGKKQLGALGRIDC